MLTPPSNKNADTIKIGQSQEGSGTTLNQISLYDYVRITLFSLVGSGFVGLNDNRETMRHPIHSWVIYLAMVLLVTKPNSTNSRMGQEAVVCNPLKRAKAPSSERTLRKHHFPLLRPHHCCKNDHPWKLSLHQAIDVIGVMLHQVLVPGMGFRSTHTISVQQNDVKFNLECYNKRT